MDLDEALAQISVIKQQVARTETFRGYKSTPVALSGILACATALAQPYVTPQPTEMLTSYLLLWMGVAAASVVLTSVFLGLHIAQSPSALTRGNALSALAQFAPALLSGALLTFVLYRHAPATAWMFPGLWAIFFGLGIFASNRQLPQETFWVGVYYVGGGLAALILGQGENALSSWQMALLFGVGQFLSAGILYWTLERPDAEHAKFGRGVQGCDAAARFMGRDDEECSHGE